MGKGSGLVYKNTINYSKNTVLIKTNHVSNLFFIIKNLKKIFYIKFINN